MKKSKIPFLAVAIAALALSSCGLLGEEPFTKFLDYAAFQDFRASWAEVPDYSFTYEVRWGDSLVYAPITATVTDGVSAVDYGGNDIADAGPAEFTDNEYLGDISFETLTEAVAYFEGRWLEAEAEASDRYQTTFSVSYAETADGLRYPELMLEDRHDIKNSGACGYGGLYLRIAELTVQ